MARALNKAQLIGNLGQDPELRYTGSGTAVCNLRVATNEVYTDRDGNQQQKTEWHTVVAWEGLAEAMGEHLEKGDRLYVEGPLETRTWEDRDGNERQTTQIKAQEVIFLGDRQAKKGGAPSNGQSQKQERTRSTAGSQGGQPESEETFEPDDELPF
jgi:single-strand DNA-binding protein